MKICHEYLQQHYSSEPKKNGNTPTVHYLVMDIHTMEYYSAIKMDQNTDTC